MRIQAFAITDGIIYGAVAITTGRPTRPILEIDVREAIADTRAPLLLPLEDFAQLADGFPTADIVRQLRMDGRVTRRDGCDHVCFPVWLHTDTSVRVPRADGAHRAAASR